MAEIHSVGAFVEMTRNALLAAGLARREAGGTVYWSGGQGDRTLVLVHGVNDQAGTWFAVAPALAKEFRLILPDLAGHGESEPKSGPIPMPLIVDRLAAVIDLECASASSRFHLLGNSMGAWISILYTLANPHRVERLVLESGGGLAIPLTVPLTATKREDAEKILRAVHGPDAAIADWVLDGLIARSTDSPMLRILPTGVLPYFIDGRLKDIRVPTTIIWGQHDGVVPRHYVETLRDGIPGAELKVIEGAAHIPHAQQPERFLACLQAIF